MSLKKRLLSSYNLSAVRAIQWGIVHEDTAVESYCSLGAEVQKTGQYMYTCFVQEIVYLVTVGMLPKPISLYAYII